LFPLALTFCLLGCELYYMRNIKQEAHPVEVSIDTANIIPKSVAIGYLTKLIKNKPIEDLRYHTTAGQCSFKNNGISSLGKFLHLPFEKFSVNYINLIFYPGPVLETKAGYTYSIAISSDRNQCVVYSEMGLSEQQKPEFEKRIEKIVTALVSLGIKYK
jgi:hypothetical protein